ncbi:MAG: glycerol-3-phosphate dehydrogenase [NAD(P)+] [Candidatus Sericytochromatia bacterium]|nr:MAG: glycerol-3-phosphate dehydrogenase [NAD(P)+] [Candidatus Sericytochromatia bacterium]
MKVKDKVISVVGGGSWGTTIANIIGENGYKVFLWLRNQDLVNEINLNHTNSKYLEGFKLSENIEATNDLKKIAESKIIFFVVPSKGFREVASKLGDYLDGEHIIIHGTKGLESDTFKRMSQILKEETPTKRIGVLSGPNLAKELMKKHPSGSVIASNFQEVIDEGIKILNNRYFTVYGNNDIIGSELGGVFKNIIAIAAGISAGLGLGDNTKSMLITRGNIELTRLGLRLGAQINTFNGLSGIGDLIATCMSPLSRNFQVGYRLAQGETLEDILKSTVYVAEGIQTTKIINDYSVKNKIPMPIVRGVYKILYEKKDIRKIINALMLLKAETEMDFI